MASASIKDSEGRFATFGGEAVDAGHDASWADQDLGSRIASTAGARNIASHGTPHSSQMSVETATFASTVAVEGPP